MFSSALAWLASRDYSEQKMREKIQKKFPFSSKEEQEKVIKMLKKENYINDEQLTENWIRFWTESENISVEMMKRKLYTKKISKEIIQEILSKTEKSNEKALHKISEHKWSSFQKLDIPLKKKQEKLLRFLLGRGFMWEESQSIMKKISGKNFEETL